MRFFFFFFQAEDGIRDLTVTGVQTCALESCRKLSNPITFVTRLRLDAALYEPAPPRRPHQIGRPRLKGERLPNLSEVAQGPTPFGSQPRSLTGTGTQSARSRSLLRRLCGTPLGCSPCPASPAGS